LGTQKKSYISVSSIYQNWIVCTTEVDLIVFGLTANAYPNRVPTPN
jgi:hypothetical protein